MINMGLIMSILTYKYLKDAPPQLSYNTGRDLVFYILGYAVVGVIYYLNQYSVIMCMVFIGYFVLYCLV